MLKMHIDISEIENKYEKCKRNDCKDEGCCIQLDIHQKYKKRFLVLCGDSLKDEIKPNSKSCDCIIFVDNCSTIFIIELKSSVKSDKVQDIIKKLRIL
jgi:hypothetical protein